jgi:iron complex transport system substrate-binding protein
MHSRSLAALVAAAVVCAASGCGADPPHATQRRAPGAVLVRAANGPVRLAGRPERIVSISPTATEDLFAVGAGKQVVAVDQFSKFPPQAPRTTLSYIDPNAEAISAYRPDLVMLSLESSKVVPALERLRIPVLVYRPAQSLAEAYEQIDQIGLATGHRRQAAAVVERMKARVKQIVASMSRGEASHTVYHELGPNYFSATSQTFIGGIYRLLGLRNIADRAAKGGEFPQLSAEYVVKADPDLIVLADTICCKQSEKTLLRRPGLREVTAVRDGHVVEVSDDLASHWGPRIVEFMQRVAPAVRRLDR